MYTCADRKIALLGAIQSLFEASMYTFVFLWTPALSPNGEKVAHGMVFACFMMSCMAGSTLAGRLLSDSARHSVSHYMKVGSALSDLVRHSVSHCIKAGGALQQPASV